MVFANDDVTVSINGQPVTFTGQGPAVVGGRTLVPIAGVFQALGFETQWNPETRQVTVTRDDDVIVITVDSSTFTTNNVSHTLDVPAQLIGGRTMLPIAPVLRTVGYEVGWDGATRTVTIVPVTPVASEPVPPAPPEQLSDDETEAEPEIEPVEDSDYHEEEDTEQEEDAPQTLIGEWFSYDFPLGIPIYVFRADGQGNYGVWDTEWTAIDGVLTIYVNVETEQHQFTTRAEWYYTVDGNYLSLTRRSGQGEIHVYTRGEPRPVSPAEPDEATPEPEEPEQDESELEELETDELETEEPEQEEVADADEATEEQAQAGGTDLTGTWTVFGSHQLMVLRADGRGHMVGVEIGWATNNGVLTICTNPNICERIGFCIAPSIEWNYTLDRNRLTLVCRNNTPGMNFNANRRR